jgi:hypothetical protein
MKCKKKHGGDLFYIPPTKGEQAKRKIAACSEFLSFKDDNLFIESIF